MLTEYKETAKQLLIIIKRKSMINKVLVVNDDPTSLLIVCKMISKVQFAKETVTANNGEMALSYFEEVLQLGIENTETVPEFIFLDLYMSGLSGWDFMDIFSKKYASLFPWVRIAVLSSYIDEEDILRFEKYKAVLAYLPAPLTLTQLAITKEKFLSLKEEELLKSFCFNYN